MKRVVERGWRAAAAIGSGLILAAAFPPFESAQAAWLGLVPLLLVARFSTPAVAFRAGWLGGMACWLPTLVWLLALSKTGTPWIVAAIGLFALSAYCALYMGMFAAAVSVLVAVEREAVPVAEAPPGGALRAVALVLIVPLLWVGCEYMRITLFTGFPWNALGVSQARNLALIQLAEWGGVYAVSALVVAINAGLAMTLLDVIPGWRRAGGPARRFHPEMLAALLLLLGAMGFGLQRVRALRAEGAGDVRVRVALVQANIPQDEKWTPELAMQIEQRLIDLTERAGAAGPDLAIWPETAVPALVSLEATPPPFMQALTRVGVPLLAGAMEIAGEDPDSRLYNSSLLLDREGAWSAVYRKQHLVPFGEYVPLARWIPWLERLAPLGYSCTPGTSPAVFMLPGRVAPVAALICFEDAIAGLARRAVRAGARLLVNQTNDAWFEGTSCALQHLHQAIFRCVEQRVPMVRCANMGVSGIIDRTGAIDAQTAGLLAAAQAQNTDFRVAAVSVPLDSWRPTFYTRWGDLPFAVPCALITLATLWRGRSRRGQPRDASA